MSVRLLGVDAIALYQRQSISDFGGSHGLRDRNLLESAVARPEHLEFYRPEASVGELAATLAWGLIKNHAFIDGNKRIGLIALVNFLNLNGYKLVSTEEEEASMVLRAAAGEMTEEQWTVWVLQVAQLIA